MWSDYLAYCCHTHCGVLSFKHDGTVEDYDTDRYASQAGATPSQIVLNYLLGRRGNVSEHLPHDGLALEEVQSQLGSVPFLNSVSFAQEQLMLASSSSHRREWLPAADDVGRCSHLLAIGDDGLVTFYRDGQACKREEGPVVAVDVKIESADVSPSGSHFFAVTQSRIYVFREGPELQP